MNFSVCYAGRNILDRYPDIEDVLLDHVFDVPREDLWISDESDLFHLGNISEMQKKIQQHFNLKIRKKKLQSMRAGELVMLIIQKQQKRNR